MPNHIKNRIELSGPLEMIDAMIQKFSTYVPASLKKTTDNNSLICKKCGDDWGYCWLDLKTGKSTNRTGMNEYGVPDGYEIEIKDSFTMFPDFAKVIPPPDCPEYRDEPSQDAVKDSPNWWYTWNTENWGSKWGGYSYKREGLVKFTYETAWSPSPVIIAAISKQFPLVTIKYSWADEDTGHNCGRAVYLNGLVSEDKPFGGSKEAYEIAFELRPDLKESYELVGESYKYKEEE